MSDSRPSDSQVWVKRSEQAPDGFFATEAAGLEWLSETETVPVVDVQEVGPHALTLRRLESVSPTAADARAFGAALASLHQTPADHFGQLPPKAQRYFFGPLEAPLSLPSEGQARFGDFYAGERLEPLVDRCRRQGSLAGSDLSLLENVCTALRDGAGDDGRGPVRVHGDLWSGNIMWTPDGGTLIDPAACGHHPYADLAMLTMFGCPHLDAIMDGYASVVDLPSSWRSAMGLHQLFGYLVHLHLFGTTYHAATLAAARSAADYLGL